MAPPETETKTRLLSWFCGECGTLVTGVQPQWCPVCSFLMTYMTERARKILTTEYCGHEGEQ